MLNNLTKGKIIIHVEKENEKINSKMEFRGITKKTEVALTTLLINFASLSKKEGKDPRELIDKHFPEILNMLDNLKGN